MSYDSQSLDCDDKQAIYFHNRIYQYHIILYCIVIGLYKIIV